MNGRQQAASSLAIYSVVTSGLGRPPGVGREPPFPAPSHTALSPPPPPCTHAPWLHLPLCHFPLYLSGFPRLPASASLLAQALPPPVGPLGPLRSLASDEPVGGRLSPGRRAGHCDCSQTRAGLSLSLFDLRGSFLEFIVFYCTWWGVWGWGEKKSLFSWALLVPSETFTKVVFSCLWRQPPELPMGTGGLGWGLSRGGSSYHPGETSPKGGLWG